ncbi:hypothetical protein V1512DRAFT_219605 [Lipomyces arxii]|uniref:uncharacterized protein n=1 Tax=Lipomyces arxii TaxID=56418 RepID=UPI0034CE220F
MALPVTKAAVTSFLKEERRSKDDIEHGNLVAEYDQKEEAESSSLLENGLNYGRSIDTESTFMGWVYDMVIWSLSVVFDLFFREIRPRGAYRIPRHGPLIFVAAPHCNQFVDPIMLQRQVRNEAGRRMSFLAAAASMKRAFVGTVARCVSSIPVARAQDNAKPGTGMLYMDSKESPMVLKGRGTKFTQECAPGTLIMLPKSMGSAEVEKVISDEELILKKDFKDNAADFLINAPSNFKQAAKIDQSEMYHHVFQRLNEGGCIGIFPEGGSHDRPSLLPLKAGVAIMALGALEQNPSLDVKIVPCGMNYFHPNKFRSRAVIEFGSPLSVPPELVELYTSGDKRGAVAQLLNIIRDALLSVTVTSPDYDTLMVIQAARRLYKPAHRKIPLSLVVEMNRRLVVGYSKYKDDPRIIHLREAVANYNKQLMHLGIVDHQVEYATLSTPEVLCKLVYRSLKLVFLAFGALPGAILFAPIFIATKKISKKKAAEALKASTVKIAAKDVIASWKIMVALGLAPALYWFYALLATWAAWKYDLVPELRPVWLITLVSMIVLPMISYAALRIGEVGMDIFKSLKPLTTCLDRDNSTSLSKLRVTRKELSREVTDVINSLGPEVFPEFETLLQQSTHSPEEKKDA